MVTVAFTLLTLIAMLIHTVAVGSSILVIRKYEDYLKNLTFLNLFNINNRCSHRVWYTLLSICVSFGYTMFAAELFIKFHSAITNVCILKYILMNIAVAVLILQYNFFILKDRRNTTQ